MPGQAVTDSPDLVDHVLAVCLRHSIHLMVLLPDFALETAQVSAVLRRINKSPLSYHFGTNKLEERFEI